MYTRRNRDIILTFFLLLVTKPLDLRYALTVYFCLTKPPYRCLICLFLDSSISKLVEKGDKLCIAFALLSQQIIPAGKVI